MTVTTLARVVRPRRLLAGVSIGFMGLLLVLGLGFAWFIHLADLPADLPEHADGIVAFTGGADRVETALRLLAENRAGKLLVSGIGGGAELDDLAHLAGVAAAPLSARVTLGRRATTTRGNALETAAWAQTNHIHSLVVVTAYYHMPRALTELNRALPGVTLFALPVQPRERGARASVPLRLLAEEYVKFLAAGSGLTAMMPVHDAPIPHAGPHIG